jgi:hypothetical protein
MVLVKFSIIVSFIRSQLSYKYDFVIEVTLYYN